MLERDIVYVQEVNLDRLFFERNKVAFIKHKT